MLSNEVFDQVYTIIKYAMADIEKVDEDGNTYKPYEDLEIVRSIRDDSMPNLPCLAVRQIGSITVGNDLERLAQNGINSTFQLDSYSNVSYEEAYEILNDVGDLMMQLGYSLNFGIQELSTPTIWRFVARFNRVVGANELPLTLN